MTKTLEVRGNLWTGSSLQPAESSITMSAGREGADIGRRGGIKELPPSLYILQGFAISYRIEILGEALIWAGAGLSQNQLGGNLLELGSCFNQEQGQKVGAVRTKSRSSSFFTQRSSLFTLGDW